MFGTHWKVAPSSNVSYSSSQKWITVVTLEMRTRLLRAPFEAALDGKKKKKASRRLQESRRSFFVDFPALLLVGHDAAVQKMFGGPRGGFRSRAEVGRFGSFLAFARRRLPFSAPDSPLLDDGPK